MLELNKGHFRILYLLAKSAEPIRKSVISQATARWNARNRDNLLLELEDAELIKSQFTPAEQGQREGRYYWLSHTGKKLVTALEEQGKIKNLPPNWSAAA